MNISHWTPGLPALNSPQVHWLPCAISEFLQLRWALASLGSLPFSIWGSPLRSDCLCSSQCIWGLCCWWHESPHSQQYTVHSKSKQKDFQTPSQCDGDLTLHISLAPLFLPPGKASGKEQAGSSAPEIGESFQAKASHLTAGLFSPPSWKFTRVDTEKTLLEGLCVDQIIEPETMVLGFKNSRTWQVLGAHPGFLVLGIN